ncbi:MAG: PAS domain-containing protein [Syntrophaceae bacterium]|nr:PAS domain-containing protein [Syntrophaceae bacterium]
MSLRFQWKLTFVLVFISLFFLLFYGLFSHILNSTFLSLFLSLLLIFPLAYAISNFLSRPFLRMVQTASGFVPDLFKAENRLSSGDELERLSKTIEQMGTQLRNRIDEISKERDYLQTVLKGMMEGVLMVDERGRILMVNEALRTLLSLSVDVADRMPLEIIRNAELEAAIRKVLQSGESEAFELTLPSSGGKTFEVNVVGIPSSAEEGDKGSERIKGAIAVFHDITRLKDLERVRQDFVANVSHELRTPLTTIKGYAETLLEGALGEEVAHRFVQVIKRHADRLTKIVEDLLMLSRIESKEFRLKIEAIPVQELIHDVLDYIKGAAEKKRVAVSPAEIPPSLIIEADRNYLEQVFTNLLDNAIKYSPEGGVVRISAIERDQEEIEFSIKDNGIGIPKEDLTRIFERFYRVDKGRSQELGGTGLGLSIVKHIVQAHGGRVWAESQPGEGSIFYFTVPVSKKS